MINASGHIEQQLSKLQTQTADIATELEALVDNYLQVLSQASKRQLVLAAYHICTQIYPERFLELNLSQRNRLQQQLRVLGDRIQSQLDEKWETAKRLSLRPAEEDGLAVIRQLFLEAASIRERPDVSDVDGEQSKSRSIDQPEAASVSQDSIAEEQSQEQLLAEIRTLMHSESPENSVPELPPAEDSGVMQPAQLMRRQILIEKAIRDVLKAASEKANDILQKADVMPEMPQALLTAAAEADRLGHTPMKTPNLVRLSIKVLHEPEQARFDKDEPTTDQVATESEQWSDVDDISADIMNGGHSSEDHSDALDEPDESDTSSDENLSMPRLLQLDALPDFVLIHLRLSEIEFAETNVAVWRSRIREKMAQLKRVGHAYKDAERQLAIAQAEDAWRASWIND